MKNDHVFKVSKDRWIEGNDNQPYCGLATPFYTPPPRLPPRLSIKRSQRNYQINYKTN